MFKAEFGHPRFITPAAPVYKGQKRVLGLPFVYGRCCERGNCGVEFIEELKLGLYQTFILDNNYQYFLKGIGITLLVTVFALILGMILGVLVAIIRSAHDQQPEKKKGIVLRILNGICKVYLTVIRGTPMLVQLLIMWFVIWASARSTDANMIRCAILVLWNQLRSLCGGDRPFRNHVH